jgi:hypothetical protein
MVCYYAPMKAINAKHIDQILKPVAAFSTTLCVEGFKQQNRIRTRHLICASGAMYLQYLEASLTIMNIVEGRD